MRVRRVSQGRLINGGDAVRFESAVLDTREECTAAVPQPKETAVPRKGLTALSLFSGGGLDLGFTASGFKVAGSSDIHPFSCKTLEINNGKRRFYTRQSVWEF